MTSLMLRRPTFTAWMIPTVCAVKYTKVRTCGLSHARSRFLEQAGTRPKIKYNIALKSINDRREENLLFAVPRPIKQQEIRQLGCVRFVPLLTWQLMLLVILGEKACYVLLWHVSLSPAQKQHWKDKRRGDLTASKSSFIIAKGIRIMH